MCGANVEEILIASGGGMRSGREGFRLQFLSVPQESFRRAGHCDLRSFRLRADADLFRVPGRVGPLRLLLLVGVVLAAGLVERGGGGAVHLEPPVTDEVRLAEDGAVGAQERYLTGCVADVEHLEIGDEIMFFVPRKLLSQLFQLS